jgi:hypothetical protein
VLPEDSAYLQRSLGVSLAFANELALFFTSEIERDTESRQERPKGPTARPIGAASLEAMRSAFDTREEPLAHLSTPARRTTTKDPKVGETDRSLALVKMASQEPDRTVG